MAGGQSFTASQGTPTLVVTIALTGILLTSAQGSVTPNNADIVPLVGQSSAVSAGTVAPSWEQALSGSEITSAAGTLTLVNNPSTSGGQVITSGAGSVTPAGDNLTVNISGEEITSASGSVSSGGQLLVGNEITSAAGIATASNTCAITGTASTCSQGAIGVAQEADDSFITSSHGNALAGMELALSGSEITGATGTILPTGDVTLALTGAESTGAAGSFSVAEEYALLGQAITSAQNNIGAPGGATLTGAESVVSAGNVFTTDDRDFALTGQSVTVGQGNAVTSYLAFVTGQELDIQQQEIGPRGATLTGLQINVGQGNVSPPIPDVVEDRPAGGYKWGGFDLRRKKKYYEYLPTPDEIEEERIRLGILPKKVQKAVAKVIEKASGVQTREQATNLAAAYFEEEQQRKLLETLRKEIASAKGKWQDEVFTVAHAMILDELQKRADREELQKMLADKAKEEEEINEVLELWMNL